MRVAFLCDIHGNRPALEAVLPELERRGPFDAIVGGGDYVTRGLDDPGVIALLRDAGWTALLRGNNEDRILGVAAHEGRIEDVGALRAEEKKFMRYTLDRLTDADLAFLATTEMSWRAAGPSGQVLLCAHAHPRDPYPHIWPDAPEAEIDLMLREHVADVYLYGHIHLNYARRTDAGMIANAGTIGGPNRDWNLHPVFVVAEDDGEGWHVRWVTVPYDRDAYLKHLAMTDVPVVDDLIEAHLSHEWDAG
ncbi:MAG: metallophosphoesterase family protein [Chloroflexota bacterium]